MRHFVFGQLLCSLDRPGESSPAAPGVKEKVPTEVTVRYSRRFSRRYILTHGVDGLSCGKSGLSAWPSPGKTLLSPRV